jgi:hypothetical protein
MFRALLAHPQEALQKRHLVYCVRVMSVGCYTRIEVELVSKTAGLLCVYASDKLVAARLITQYASSYIIIIIYLFSYLLQLSFRSVAVVLTLVQTKQIRININTRK